MTFDKKANTKLVTCKQCGRQLKGVGALGGHMGKHKKNTQDVGPTADESSPQPAEVVTAKASEAVQQAPETAAQPIQQPASSPLQTVSTQPDSRAEEIRKLIVQGYTVEQLKTEPFNYSETTIRQEWRKLVKPAGRPINEDTSQKDGMLPMTVKGTELITPEAVLQHYADGDRDAQLELKGMMKLRASMLMVMDLMRVRQAEFEAYAKMMEPHLKLMQETRLDMDAAAKRASASVDEVAQKASAGTAARLADFLEPRLEALEKKVEKPSVASDSNPMAMISRTWETAMNQMLNKLGFGGQPGQGGQAPPGYTITKKTEEKNG